MAVFDSQVVEVAAVLTLVARADVDLPEPDVTPKLMTRDPTVALKTTTNVEEMPRSCPRSNARARRSVAYCVLSLTIAAHCEPLSVMVAVTWYVTVEVGDGVVEVDVVVVGALVVAVGSMHTELEEAPKLHWRTRDDELVMRQRLYWHDCCSVELVYDCAAASKTAE